MRTKYPQPKPLRRTKFPPANYPSKTSHSYPVVHLSPSYCRILERVLSPPLTRSQIILKQGNDRIIPTREGPEKEKPNAIPTATPPSED